MGLAQILRGLSYKGCSEILVTRNFFAFGLYILVFGIAPLYTNSLLICYDDIRDLFIEI